MKKILLATSILLGTFFQIKSQSINSVTINNGNTFCTGANIDITTQTSGTFGIGNVFTAEISNENGLFNSGTYTLAALTGSIDANFTSIIPNVASQSAIYKIKVKSSNPATEFETSFITINQTVSLSLSSTNLCSNSTAAAITRFPSNGTYSGVSGAIGGNFYPTLAPVGTNSIIYSIPNNGCQNSDTVTVTVSETPATPLISGNAIICPGSSNTFIVSNANSTYTYNWFEGVNNLNTSTTNISISSGGSYTVVANNNGCIATSQPTNISVSPAPSIFYINAPSSICQSSNPILLSGIPAGGSFGTTNVIGGYFTPNTVGNNTITYSIQNQYGCEFITTKDITVNPKATVSFVGITPLCLNASNLDLANLFTVNGGSGIGSSAFSGLGVTGNIFSASTAGVGTHPITCTYTDSIGCSSAAIGNIQVLANSNVNFTLPQNICNGTDSISLIGAPVNGTFSGNGVLNNVFYPQFAGVGNHIITYTTTASGTLCSASASQTISVYNLTINSGSDFTTNCGSPATLNATTNYLGTSNISYSWSPSLGLSNTTISNTTTNATNNTNYTVTASVNGCIASDSILVSVTQAQFNVSFSNQSSFVAPPFNVAFSNNTPSPFLYSFSWDFGDGSTLNTNSQTVVHQYLTNGTFTVTLTATNNITGCVDSYTSQNAVTTSNACSHTATINQTSPIIGCSGDEITLTCNTIVGAQYQWNLNGFPISGAPNPTYTATQSGSYTVTIYVNGCPQSSSAVLITLNSSPANPSINITGSIVFCAGGSTSLQANGGFQNYLWKKNGVLIPGVNQQTITITETGYYSVSAFDANGCSSSSAQQAINSSFLAPPNMCVVSVDQIIKKPVISWQKPANLTPIKNYYLMRESNVTDIYDTIATLLVTDFSSFTDLDPLVNTNVKTYKYKLALQDTCESTTLPSSLHKTILLQTSIGLGSQVNLLWNNYEGLPTNSYIIYRGTDVNNMDTLDIVAASNGQFNFYTDNVPNFTETFYYRVDLVIESGYECTPSKSFGDREVIKHSQSNAGSNKTIMEDVAEILAKNEFTIAPNPTNGHLNVAYKSFSNELINIEVSNILGSTVHKESWNISGVDGNRTLHLSNLENGVYFINFKQGNKTNTSKVVISK